jgi:hypothetical protein
MREVTPRTPDPDRVFPDEGAEPIMAVTFGLELPFSLRVPELQFVVSRPGSGWDGWGPDEIGHLIDLRAKIPDGYEPHFRIALNQAAVTVPAPWSAAKLAFPEWEGFGGDEEGNVDEARTTALVSVYTRMFETPFGDDDDRAVTEWLSRQFDDALGLLNDYLVILAAMHDEWHISRISRADLPRRAPFRLEIRPTRAGATSSSSTLDVHATLRDDLPDERDANELLAAVELIQRYREGRAPFWDWVQYYQAAEHHLGSGRYDQSVIAATTAMEVLVNIFFREVWEALELDPGHLTGVLGCGFKNQLTHQLPKFLSESVDLDNEDLPPGRWYQDCYGLRNRTVHEGRRPSSAEAMDAKVATRAFAAWIGASMHDDERTAQIKAILQAPVGERRR